VLKVERRRRRRQLMLYLSFEADSDGQDPPEHQSTTSPELTTVEGANESTVNIVAAAARRRDRVVAFMLFCSGWW